MSDSLVIEVDDDDCVEYVENGSQEEISEINVEESPCEEEIFQVLFNNEDNFCKMKSCLKRALTDCFVKEGTTNVKMVEDKKYLRLLAVKDTSVVNTEIDSATGISENTDSEESNLNFSIDTTPQLKIDRKSIPFYTRIIGEMLNEEPCQKKLKTEESLRPNAKCFNCEGNHSLRDCREPRNQQTINKNRKSFTTKTERYHKDIKQKNCHISPGDVSCKLRRALDLQKGEIPFFVYRMRRLGYPPGWLEEAKVPDSGLMLFNSEGQRVLGSDEEEGEVTTRTHKYDVDRIISFPGYNVNPGPGFLDDYRRHDVPPIQPKFLKETFIKSLGDKIINQGYKRKKLKSTSANENSTVICAEDMEIENLELELPSLPISVDSVPCSPSIQPPPLPTPEKSQSPPQPPPSPSSKDDEKSQENSRDSPSFIELMEKKKKLLEALDISSVMDTSVEDCIPNEEKTLENNQEQSTSSNNVDTVSDTNNCELKRVDNSQNYSNQEKEMQGTPTQSTSSSITQTLGTPILKFSRYDKLPSSDKFAQGVSEVINFENLSDSTGKYEQMKKFFQNIRKNSAKTNKNE